MSAGDGVVTSVVELIVGLDNYDAFGRWRDSDGKFPVDVTGTLPAGMESRTLCPAMAGITPTPSTFRDTVRIDARCTALDVPCRLPPAVDFPDLPIIMAHPSFPWQDEALSVCLHKPHVSINLSGWSPKYFLRR